MMHLKHLSAGTPANARVYFAFPGAMPQTATGNLLTKTDAKDKVAKYVVDNLNRVTQIKYYPTTANANANTSADETVTYTFDTCTNGKGRLCTLADKSGTTTYSYDIQGRTTSKAQAVASLPRPTAIATTAPGKWISSPRPAGK